jgi:spermidine synthase
MATYALEQLRAEKAGTNWLLLMLSLLFFGSGVSALIYQVLWLRQLSLVFGVTMYAASTVLASFMAGLAIGSFAAGRLVDRARNPLLWYGIAELLVGASAAATPALLSGVQELYANLYPSLPHDLSWLTLARFVLSFAVLIVPTTLMGATLPMIVKSSLVRSQGLGQRVSVLYATNTSGAIVGTLLAGFFLIGGIGMRWSFWIAAGINFLAGALSILLSTRADSKSEGALSETDEAMAVERDTDAADAADVLSATARRVVLVVFGLSGFISLALEVVWFRILILFLEVSTYAFTVMLATFLCGIAAGSYVIAPLMRKRIDWLKTLALIEMGIAILSALSLAGLALVYRTPAAADIEFAGEMKIMLAASFFAIFPATLLMGVAFPIGLRLWAADDGTAGADAGRKIGLFYSVNVFGAIPGSIAAGFVLLPRLGSRASLIILSAATLISGLMLLAALSRRQRRFALVAGIAGCAVFIAAVVSMPNPAGLILKHRYPGDQVLWREEGPQVTVSVQRDTSGRRVMYIDGMHQANDSDDMVRNHRWAGVLPALLHRDPKQALVVGLGGGVTAGSLSEVPGISVDVVELSDTVVKGAAWFDRVNSDVLNRPNVHLRVDDGRNYLMLTPKRYDVITADLIHPTHPGAGSLYSAEYYRLARNALSENGIVVQRIGPRAENQYKIIVRTFLSVFPNATLWARGKLLIGSARPLELDRDEFERRAADPDFQAVMRSMGLKSFDSLARLYNAGPDELRELVGEGPILTDDRPMVEYFLALGGDSRMITRAKFDPEGKRHDKGEE